ncbi:glycoside hydrolase family 47 protein [Pluteus cervinus]|uniref:Glycoside hydrolase family 47 protein n=1 Tax=Pluteus cervinus TaxID=181527 RepID=A0ACD3AF57_9AGAR|nr:glycoside hydrolase family 47 protein [Pluteus cervinus]
MTDPSPNSKLRHRGTEGGGAAQVPKELVPNEDVTKKDNKPKGRRIPRRLRYLKSPARTLARRLGSCLILAGVFVYVQGPDAILRKLGFRKESEWDHRYKIDFSTDYEKRDAVVDAFKHAWSAYERDAMGDDEYHPIGKTGSNLTKSGGIGYTVVDAIDTIQIMGLQEEYSRARSWVENKLSFDREGNFNTFETTIRVLGGLLSAYHLSENDELYLNRAIDLADRMLPAFDTNSGLPMSSVDLKGRRGIKAMTVSTAEAATLQLEMKYLSYLTDREEFWEKSENVIKLIKNARNPSGLVPIYMSDESGQFMVSEIRLGSRGDSYYEYLLKQFLQTNQAEEVYREMYQYAMDSMHQYLIKFGVNQNTTYTTELQPVQGPNGQLMFSMTPKQDHLVCFLGGSLLLGAVTTGAILTPVSVPPKQSELTPNGQRDWSTGVRLIETCVGTYDTLTGLSPEIAHFFTDEDEFDHSSAGGKDWYIKASVTGVVPYDARYILRPETVESLFIAYRLTGNPKYRAYGWKIFQSIEKHCKVESGGYASVLNVADLESEKEDRMETFFLSETLKYLYLLFSDQDVLPLDKYVFNTEAHPLPVFQPHIKTGFS